MGLSIVIPCYNEVSRVGYSLENRIESVITSLGVLFDDEYDYEIILVSDGSTDTTGSVILDLSYKYPFVVPVLRDKNKGKGYSIKEGVLKASKEFILIMDADLSTDLKHINSFYNSIKDYDSVIGIRSDKYNTRSRRLLSVLSHFCMTKILKLDVKDTQCGFKMIKSDILKEFCTKFQTCDRWLFDAELLVFLKQNNFNVLSENVHWENSSDSRVTLFGGTLTSCFELLRISGHIKDYRL